MPSVSYNFNNNIFGQTASRASNDKSLAFFKSVKPLEPEEKEKIDTLKVYVKNSGMRQLDSSEKFANLSNLHNQGAIITSGKMIKKREGMSKYLATSAAAFKLDGPDDLANAVKELVEGIAQPLMHMGVIAGFLPFVWMGAKGLHQEQKESAQDKRETLQEIHKTQLKILELKQSLEAESDHKNNKVYEHILKHIPDATLGAFKGAFKKKNQFNPLDNFDGSKLQFSAAQLKALTVNASKQIEGMDQSEETSETESALSQDASNLRDECNASFNLRSTADSDTASDVSSLDVESLEPQQKLEELVRSALKLSTLQVHLSEVKADNLEHRLAFGGMAGMFGAMVGFLAEASCSLMTFLTSGTTKSIFANANEAIGIGSTGVMGVAQLLMTLAGLVKAGTGIKTGLDMRAEIKHMQRLKDVHAHASNEQPSPITKALTDQIEMKKREKKWRIMEKVIPGGTLSIGQAAMCAWSVISLACTFSGVATPAGLALMLPLLIPGVGLTLAASLPKIGLDNVFEDKVDKRYGMHDEEVGFDKSEYQYQLFSEGKTDAVTLAEHLNVRRDHLKEIEALSGDDLIKKLTESDNAEDEKPQNNIEVYGSLKSKLQTVGRMDSFAEDAYTHKSLRHNFSTQKLVEWKPVDQSLRFSHLFKPWTLSNYKLFNRGDEKAVTTQLHQIMDDPHDDAYIGKLNSVAADTLKNYAVRQLRAEIDATHDVFLSSLSGEQNENRLA